MVASELGINKVRHAHRSLQGRLRTLSVDHHHIAIVCESNQWPWNPTSGRRTTNEHRKRSFPYLLLLSWSCYEDTDNTELAWESNWCVRSRAFGWCPSNEQSEFFILTPMLVLGIILLIWSLLCFIDTDRPTTSHEPNRDDRSPTADQNSAGQYSEFSHHSFCLTRFLFRRRSREWILRGIQSKTMWCRNS